jgi:hypothetical protein
MARRVTKTVEPAGGNVAGADPHRVSVSVTVLDERGGLLGTKHFKVSGVGHRAMWEWVQAFGPVARFGIENASGIGRHTAMFLIERGVDVRDVCPTRTAEQARRRREGKSDALDATRIARETLADPRMPAAFKRAGTDVGPDPVREQILLWHKARRSLLKTRLHLLNEADHLLIELPLELRAQLPRTSDVRRLLRSLQDLDTAGFRSGDPTSAAAARRADHPHRRHRSRGAHRHPRAHRVGQDNRLDAGRAARARGPLSRRTARRGR